jgi:hypothetical protein
MHVRMAIGVNPLTGCASIAAVHRPALSPRRFEATQCLRKRSAQEFQIAKVVPREQVGMR